jgi:hypothetical protein
MYNIIQFIWYNGQEYTGRLDFNIHMVGLNNGTWARPWLRAIHGPSELVGERLELCARQHYAKDYKYVRFMHCMDEVTRMLCMCHAYIRCNTHALYVSCSY